MVRLLVANERTLPFTNALNEVLQNAIAATRAVFTGDITYAAGSWEEVNWDGFDIVSVNLYKEQDNQATYLDDLRKLHQWGKPIAITEFGCCCYRGADLSGGGGFDVVDWEKPTAKLRQDLVRSEQTQADYLTELLRLYSAEGVFGAFIFTFIEPTNTYSPDPRFDLDMASYGIVKVYAPNDRLQLNYWEPKVAFYTVAKLYNTL